MGQRALLRPDGSVNILGTGDFFPAVAGWLAQLEQDALDQRAATEKQRRYDEFMKAGGVDLAGAAGGVSGGGK